MTSAVDLGLPALPFEPHPAGRGRLTAIARADAGEQVQIALESIARGRLSSDRRFRGDIQEDRQVRRRQEPLDFGEPGGVEPVRFAVGDARRDVAIADDDDAGRDPGVDPRALLAAIRDVEELQDVRWVVALAVQRLEDLVANGRRVVGKRQQLATRPWSVK